MRAAYRLVVLVLVLPVVTFGQQVITDNGSIPFNKAIQIGKTKNGIPFYFLRNGKPKNRIDLILTVNAGAVLEDDDQNGLAHFCEHMAFNGTKEFPKQQLVNFLESTGIRFGADLNAYTNQDETVYMLTVPSDKTDILIKAIKVLRDWAGFVNYEDDDIEEERGVVTEEWRMRRGAETRVQEKHRMAMYNGSKYAYRDVIGDTVILKTAPPDNLRRFYRKWYTPENMAIIMVGDVDFGTMHDIVMKYFVLPSEAGKSGQLRPTITIPDNSETLVSIATDHELRVPYVELLYRRQADTVRTYKEFREHIIESMVVEMLNARLAELAQKATPPFTGASTGEFSIAREYRSFYARASASGKNIMIALNALLTEIERAYKHGFTETELARSKEQTLSNIEKYYNERDKTENQNFAFELVRHVLKRESVPGIEHETEIYKHYVPGVTVEDCKRVFNRLITKNNRAILVSIPDGTEYTKPTEKQVKDLVAAIAAKELAPYEDNVPLKPLLATAPKPGTITSTKNADVVDAKVLTLSNGATVILKKTNFKNDEILFRAEAFGGQSLGSEADHFTLQSAATLVDISGISEFDNTTLMKMLQGKNIALSPYIGMEEHGLRGSTTPKDATTFFELVYLYFTQPRIDADAVSSWKTRSIAQLENKDKSPEAGFFDTIQVALANNHPRVQPLTVASIEKVDPAKALAFYKTLFAHAGSFTFTIVGNFDMAEMENYVKTYIASLPSAGSPLSWKDVGLRTAKGKIERTVYKGEEPKSFVVLTISGKVKYTPQNRYEILALKEVLETRLREKLREQSSGVYFVSVQPQIEKIPEEEYSMAIIFSCNPDRVEELVGTTLKEIDTLKMKPVSATYTDKVREIHLKEREVNLSTNRFWSEGLLRTTKDGEPFDVIEERKKLIEALSPDHIFKAAKEYLKLDNYGKFVLKPATK